MWKLEQGVISSKSFPKHGMHQMIDTVSSNCKLYEEDNDHIFWKCLLAAGFWFEVAHGWCLNKVQTTKLSGDFWSAKEIFRGANLKQHWTVTICAGLWTLWLARNELVFQNITSSSSKLLALLKIRSFKWILAYSWFHKDLEDLWNVNPVGAILLYNKKRKELIPSGGMWNI